MNKFLRKASILLSLCMMTSLAACTSNNNSAVNGNNATTESSSEWDKEVNLLVIGAGGSGLTAAVEAATNGTENILVVEKLSSIGGVTALSQGVIAGYDTQIAKKLGVNVTKEELYDILMGNATYRLDPKLASITVEKSGESIDWLIDTVGVPFDEEIRVGYGPLQMMHVMTGGGNAIVEPFKKALEDNNVELMLETPATKLLKDDNGNITGAIVENEGKELKIKAKAVVLATGGYAGNKDLPGLLNPSYQGMLPVGFAGNTGDGLIMGSDVGAAIGHTDHLMAVLKDYEILSEKNGNSATASVSAYVKADSLIFVGADAKRFMDEKAAGFMSQELNQPIWDQMKKDDMPYVWAITDAKGLEQTKSKRGLDLEYITADTVEDLASKMNLDPSTLKATVDAWNTSATNGVDADFRRTAGLTQLEAPYYAVAIAPAHIITYGGVIRNENAEVLKADGTVLNGLFACGEVSANSAYMGFTISNAITWGRIAGASASDYIKNGPKAPVAEDTTGEKEEATAEAFSFNPGTYEGTARGNGGDLKVSVVVDENSIKEVTVLEHLETEGLADPALEKVPTAIVSKQSLSVDTVTGATVTSNAIIDAVKSALESAKK
ncbi:MAG: FAD-dependent oxidoreductase [Clostridium sp.]|nr:FAD-dependent oxidoreductase [Clostridium sp.]